MVLDTTAINGVDIDAELEPELEVIASLSKRRVEVVALFVRARKLRLVAGSIGIGIGLIYSVT